MKLMVPPPVLLAKVQPQEIALDANDLEESDSTEPSGPPVIAVAEAVVPPPPISSSVLLGPAKALAPIQPSREIAMSLPSQFEIDSERKSSPPIAERRKELTKYVASAVGVAWFICTCAIGETALRSLIASMH
jgi:hypothetical protein